MVSPHVTDVETIAGNVMCAVDVPDDDLVGWALGFGAVMAAMVNDAAEP